MRMRTKIRIKKPKIEQNVYFGHTTGNIFNCIAKYKCESRSGSNCEQLAKMCREKAWMWSRLPLFQVLHDFDKIIEIFAQHISHPTSLGKPPLERRKGRKKKKISPEEAINRQDPTPWLMIPTKRDLGRQFKQV